MCSIELGGRLKLPAFMTQEGKPKYRDYADFVVNFETEPGPARLPDRLARRRRRPPHRQAQPRRNGALRENNCVFHYPLQESLRYMRNWNRGYNDWAQRVRMRRHGDPLMIALYSEVMQRFRLAAQGSPPRRQPPERLRERVEKLLRSAAVLLSRRSRTTSPTAAYPAAAITQRPMAMYHSWDSQNAWLRQIHGHNFLFVNPADRGAQGIADGGWMWIESQWGRVRCMARYSEAVEPGTVWTWNAIGKAARRLGARARRPGVAPGLHAQ